ncbi:hypothetical protein D3C85_1198290 [compost metagenome]
MAQPYSLCPELRRLLVVAVIGPKVVAGGGHSLLEQGFSFDCDSWVGIRLVLTFKALAMRIEYIEFGETRQYERCGILVLHRTPGEKKHRNEQHDTSLQTPVNHRRASRANHY